MAVATIDTAQFRQQVLEGDRPALVDFWAPWCVHCRRIGPAIDQVAQQYGEQLLVAKVNIDEEPILAQQEAIEVIPTLVLYRDGKALDSIVVPDSKAKIEALIRQHVGI